MCDDALTDERANELAAEFVRDKIRETVADFAEAAEKMNHAAETVAQVAEIKAQIKAQSTIKP